MGHKFQTNIANTNQMVNFKYEAIFEAKQNEIKRIQNIKLGLKSSDKIIKEKAVHIARKKSKDSQDAYGGKFTSLSSVSGAARSNTPGQIPYTDRSAKR